MKDTTFKFSSIIVHAKITFTYISSAFNASLKNKTAVQVQIIIKYPSQLLTFQTPEAQEVNWKTTIPNLSPRFPVPNMPFLVSLSIILASAVCYLSKIFSKLIYGISHQICQQRLINSGQGGKTQVVYEITDSKAMPLLKKTPLR